eukprot:1643019-Alexandrium_andersonii.AAC.1
MSHKTGFLASFADRLSPPRSRSARTTARHGNLDMLRGQVSATFGLAAILLSGLHGSDRRR